ncbi:MAG: choice-of-anchor tandem repeat GloVer-containing protein [Chitinophagaceae bacterium]
MLKLNKLLKSIFLILFVCSNAILANAQTAMVGMTSVGGDEFGVIYQTSPSGNNQTVVHAFEGNSGVYPYYTQLCQALNGKLYGLTSQGGSKQSGVVFEYDINTGKYIRKVEFKVSNGSNPRGSMILASNGKLYGMTSQGGSYNHGIIFEYTPGSDSIIVKHHFDGANGRNPFGNLFQASNGKLYGMTYQGGATNDGVIFEYNPANDSFYKRHDFDGTNTGRNPFGSLMQASNGLLYGLTYQGGSNNLGILFNFNVNNNSFSKLQDFTGTATGSNPYSTPVQAADGHLYAMAYLGGSNNLGTLFQYDIAGDTIIKKIDFNGSGNGRNPIGDLMLASNGKLYGQLPFGGSAGAGLIFEYITSSNSFSKLFEWSATQNGRVPFGSLMQASNQQLYGLTYSGGINNSGVLFEYSISGANYIKKLDFGSAINGSNPYGNLIMASNLTMYGMTYQGGADNSGVIFSFDPVQHTYKKQVDFKSAQHGSNTYGSLIQASNGKLYGMLYQGGDYGYGSIIEYDPVQDTCIKLFDFDGSNSGRNPYGDLLQASNGKLYGMTPYGGTDDYGVIFEFDIASKQFQKLHDFNGADGGSPFGTLLQHSNGKLYGLTYNGGSSDAGVLFDYSVSGNTYSMLMSFTGTSTGTYPLGTLLEMNDSNLYGMTQYGGDSNAGVVFRFHPNGSVFEKVEDFSGTSGKNPTGQLAKAGNNKLYGKTQYGGTANSGVIFELDLSKDTLVSKVDFIGDNGSLPYGSLLPFCLPQYDTLKVSVCDSFKSPSGRYLWFNSGTYSDTLQAYTGCDSILSLDVTILKKSFSTIHVSVCDSFIAPDNQVYKTNGTKTAVIRNYLGCDSTITIHLSVLRTDTFFKAQVCDSFIAPDGKVYQSSGSLTATIKNAAGCDSVIQIQLEVLNTQSTITTTACRTYTAPDGKVYKQSGVYKARLTNARNCDSLITINLTINTVDRGISIQDSVLTASASTAIYQWLYCDSGYKKIPGATSRTYTARKNGRYSVAVTENSCTDTSDCVRVSSLSIGENLLQNMKIYPNPGEGKLFIELGRQYFEIHVTIFDSEGREVFVQNLSRQSELTIEPALRSGIYTIRLQTEAGVVTQTIVRW